MILKKNEFNKALQIFGLSSRLLTLSDSLYQYDYKAKVYVPVKNFAELFGGFIKTVEDLKRHRPQDFYRKFINMIDFPREQRKQ